MCNILPALICIYNAMYEIYANTCFKGKCKCAPSFLVCTHFTTCVHAHSLDETLVTITLKITVMITVNFTVMITVKITVTITINIRVTIAQLLCTLSLFPS